jgi:hypothetical protein
MIFEFGGPSCLLLRGISSERLRTKLALRPDWFQSHLPSGTH